MWDSMRQDIGFGIRMLRRQPGFTLMAVLTLALGIGATTAIFGIVDAVLWRSLPYSDPDRIVSLTEQRPREGRLTNPVSPADFYDWRADSRSFTAMTAYMETSVNLSGSGEPERLAGLNVTPEFLTVLGIQPSLGRDFRSEEETFGRHRVALLTDGLWKRRFGMDASIVGRSVTFDGNNYEVIGVLPPSFWWPAQPDVLTPLALADSDRRLRGAHFLEVAGRTRDGVPLAQAAEEMRVIGSRLSAAYPAENANHAPYIRPIREALIGDMRTPLVVLLGAVALVLLIACANVAMLMVARAIGRQKELAVRMAVGGGRVRLVRQMLTESLLLAAVGGGSGLLFAAWTLSSMHTLLPVQFVALPGIDRLTIDMRVLLVSLGLSATTGVVFGVAPALVASDQRLSLRLNEETRGGTGGSRSGRVRSTLVVAELALSLVLLVGAGLLLASFKNLLEVSPGFHPERVLTSRLVLPAARYPNWNRAVVFYQSVFERLRGMPGVEHVGATTAPPFTGFDSRLDLEIEHRIPDPAAGPVRAHPRLVTPDYFVTMGIPLLRGRRFTDHDNVDAPNVVMINEAAARQYWQNEDPMGQRISLGSPARWMEIVGIVGDIRHQGLDAEATPEAYIPYEQNFTSLGNGLIRGMSLVVRSGSDPGSMASFLRSIVKSLDDQLPVGVVVPLNDLIARSVAARRLVLTLVSGFALVAVILSAAGLYGVMSYVVAQRTREIGVRLALGASRANVLQLMARQAGTMTLIGFPLGLAGAYVLARYMATLLFGVTPSTASIYAAVSAFLATVEILAIIVPTARATRVDPVRALRD